MVVYLGGGDLPADFRPEFLPMDFSSGLGEDFPCEGTAGVGFGGSDLDEGRWESNGGEGDLTDAFCSFAIVCV